MPINKQMMHISALVPANKIFNVMVFLEQSMACNLEVKTFMPATASNGHYDEKREEIIKRLTKKSPQGGTQVCAGLEVSNPHGFLTRMAHLGLIKKGKIKGQWAL